MTDAETEWLAMSSASSRPLTGSTGRVLPGEFRQLGSAVAWPKWDAETITIARMENKSPTANGDAKALLGVLTQLADRYELTIIGNAISYPTDERPDIDQKRLVRLYVTAGFTVGDPPSYMLNYNGKLRR